MGCFTLFSLIELSCLYIIGKPFLVWDIKKKLALNDFKLARQGATSEKRERHRSASNRYNSRFYVPFYQVANISVFYVISRLSRLAVLAPLTYKTRTYIFVIPYTDMKTASHTVCAVKISQQRLWTVLKAIEESRLICYKNMLTVIINTRFHTRCDRVWRASNS